MNILVIGKEAHLKECQAKFGNDHQYVIATDQHLAQKSFKDVDVTFDFVIEDDLDQMEVYLNYLNSPIFFNTSTVSLATLTKRVSNQINRALFGFCGMPTFLNRELLEVSLRSETDSLELQRVCKKLSTDYVVVDDRVGLVTPRVICMIINEAYYTVEEGTATKQDIDIAMKLGTNYPFGPFEWCEKIGARNVCELLQAMYVDTNDERYKVSSLLEKSQL